MLKRVLCVLLLMVAVGATLGYAQTQTPTTQGTRFWVSFMRNGYRSSTTTDRLTLFASAKRGCKVTVSNPNTHWSDEFVVPGNSVASFLIQDVQGYCDQDNGLDNPSKINKGLFVVAEDTISLYIANETHNSYDAANVLPVEALGSKYMVQTNKSLYYTDGSHAEDNRASFLVIATEDNTQVQITPSCETMDHHPQGVAYSITLQAGQCYHVLNKNPGNVSNVEGDFSGTLIESLNDKPIAVFNGNTVTSVADGPVDEGYDHVFEQAMPVDNWGKHFVVTKTKGPHNLQNDRVKITALYDHTEVLRDGVPLCPPLDAGQSYAFWMTQNCCYLESSGPVAVYLYHHSHSSNNIYGDPSMVWISPVEQTLQDVIFSTFSSAASLTHYVNVVCYTEDLEHLELNGNPVPQAYIEGQVPGAPQFSYARVLLSTPGKNSLSCPSGLVAHVYGMGDRQGYAYTVGSSAKTLTKLLYVDDILSTNLPNGYTVCQNDPPIQFRTEFNYDFDHVSWDFGDGTFGEGQEVLHEYASIGHYDVEAVVYRDLDKTVQPFDTLSVTVHVNPLHELTVSETTCEPTFVFRGNTYPVPYFNDTILSGNEGCDTVCHLNIMEGPSVSLHLYDTACKEYMWFDTLRDESNTYMVVVNQEGGCDSLYILHLIIGQPPEKTERYKTSCDPYWWDDRILCDATATYTLPFTTEEHCEYDSVLYFTLDTNVPVFLEKDTCDQYEWMGNVYSELGTQTYDTTIVGDNGCNNHHVLELTLHASPPFEEILGLSNVAVATSYWPGEYNYYLDDSTGMDTDPIRWELLDNPAGPGFWELKPHGASCTVMAYSMGTKTLRVTSNNGPCEKEAFKTINCSGYALDENGLVDLEIYPNPAKDELVVKGSEILEVNLYNLLGQKVLSVSANGRAVLSVDVGDLPSTLYLLEVRTMKGNKTQLISVIN